MLFRHFSNKHILTMMGVGILTTIIVLACIFLGSSSARSKSNQHGSSPVDLTNSSIELVHILFRHGPRTPVNTYPRDPYVNDTFSPTGWGHITNRGKQELYELGTWLKRRYGKLINPFYSPNLVYAQSTASPRTLMSMSTVLASLFSPRNTPMDWNPDLNWQPIPIFSEPVEQDALLMVRTPCPRYNEALEEVLQSSKVRAELEQYTTLFENLTEIAGMPVQTADDVNSLYITLEAEREFGLALPAWTKDYYPEKMRFLAERSYTYNAYTTEMQKIKGGPFVKKMIEEMLAKRENKLQPRERMFFIYAAHDWTVANILSALKVWKRQMPRFSIMTIFELHKDRNSGEYFIKVFLKNGAKDGLHSLSIPNCGVECSLDRLVEVTKSIIPNETQKERCEPKKKADIDAFPPTVDQVQQ